MHETIARTEAKIGYTFRDKDLLVRALTHSSYLNEHKDARECNERLEFLGDSVLSLICSDHLYHTRTSDEGALTKTKALLVCEEALSTYARELQLGESLLLGRGEKNAGAENRNSILCDEIEAILGAIYLDGGYEEAKKFILPFLIRGEEQFHQHDYKTLLQEVIQKNRGELLRYVIADQFGPEHEKTFVCHLYLNSNRISEGRGRSKKSAEQAAAKKALELMGVEE
ncbi:MAG: ribonuclease III [Clostridia bacterium]|nr:ribonuclease III [Clostridia bacterium]MBQ2271946.1 ribonuclease III [Clostridia bacterium]MBQ5820465.1 ribonuclease III [Clostridia bacterium]